jgi:AraC-like DNA-binding protein/mannose-6-phosphate isomerase-like protein (cupin superfamily)
LEKATGTKSKHQRYGDLKRTHNEKLSFMLIRWRFIMHPDYLFEYPNMDSSFPFYMVRKHLAVTPPHRHDFLELSLVLEGQGTEAINGVEHDMKPGTMILLLPYQVHEIHALPGQPLLLYTLNFDLKLLLGAENHNETGMRTLLFEDTDTLPSFIQLDAEAMAEMKRVFDTMRLEYEREALWMNMLVKNKLLEALYYFDRYRKQTASATASAIQALGTHIPTQPGKRQPPSQKLRKRSIWPVVQHIHQNYREPVNLSQLASLFQFNPSHLSELFKSQLGQNFVHFIQELRVRHAAALLRSTELTIVDVAVEAGFGSLPSFMRAFKSRKGTTPSLYRANSNTTPIDH